MNIKDNKLIAEFMEFKLQTNEKERWFGQWFPKTTLNKPYTIRVEILHFDTDWNWLMEVVSKIRLTVMKDDIDDLYNSEHWDKITHALVEVNINEINYACVEFIKWYNQINENIAIK